MSTVVPPEHRRHFGNEQESLAAEYLNQQGLILLERNYYTRLGEIDLIMQDGDTLVFIEVRSRTNADFIDPITSINARKQKRMHRAAQVYLKHHRLTNKVKARIDVLGMLHNAHGGTQFNWIKNALGP
jgi:putative endonuclease